jgi:hypothetical protein
MPRDAPASNWKTAPSLFYNRSDRYALALDAQGSPRIVWNQGQSNVPAAAALDDTILYGWCDAQCESPDNWKNFTVGLPNKQGTKSLSLALTQDSRPIIAYDAEPSPYAQSVVVCKSQATRDSSVAIFSARYR